MPLGRFIKTLCSTKENSMIDKLSDIKPFEIFNKTWALLTAGPFEKHNSMTISWGEMGTLWGKNVCTVYVKPCRYTYQFMEANDYFVLSYFDEAYRNKLAVMGSKSGRDVNKDELAGLTPIKHGEVTIYQEAKFTIICKKIYHNDLLIDNIPEKEKNTHYKTEKPHRMYVGEVIEILK